MKTATVCFSEFWSNNSLPPVGHEFYMVDMTFNNYGGETRLEAFNEPQRTNMSHEPRVEGWLGETDNINKQALGKWRIVEVLSKRAPQYYNQGVKVKIEKVP